MKKENTAQDRKTVWPFYREILAEHSALWADKYALTMSQALFSAGKHDINTTFHSYIRTNPFQGGYLITAGQNIVLQWMKDNWTFDEVDIATLRMETTTDAKTGQEKPLYTNAFLEMLEGSKFELTVDAMPEGELAFPDEPIMRVNGPVWQCLMVEACILNCTNSQSLFATLMSRLRTAVDGDKTIELGLRRAQALGGLEPSRGAYIGGCDGTSNMLARKYYGIPAVGTMAHAYVMFHENETEAFENYATHMPDNFLTLADTYNTINGLKNTIAIALKTGVDLKGSRLDSGDLLHDSIAQRQMFDAAGFPNAAIAASNDLNEKSVRELKKNGAKISVWGFGTNLVTAQAQPALGGVYKLGAVFDYHRSISPEELDALRDGIQSGVRAPEELNTYVRETIKLSGDAIKTSIPGELDVVRHLKQVGDRFVFNGDTITDHLQKHIVDNNTLSQTITTVQKKDASVTRQHEAGTTAYNPLQRYFTKGAFTGTLETIHDARARATTQLGMLEENVRSLDTPEIYPVGLEQSLYDKRQQKIAATQPVAA